VTETGPSGGGGPGGYARCSLGGDPATASTSDDTAATELGRGGGRDAGTATLAMHVTRVYSSTGSMTLRCRWEDDRGSSHSAVAEETKILLVEIGSTTRTELGGGSEDDD
jgi:uncharacterized protein YodC (DUF2158 family)